MKIKSKFQFRKTSFKGLYLIKSAIFKDFRGEFYRAYCKDEFLKIFFKNQIKQTNICINKQRGTLRGLHYQISPHQETKIISCIKGEILDVVVDLRKNSKTYFKHYSKILSERNKHSIIVPKGFAHGYMTLKKNSIVVYLVDKSYNRKAERIIKHNDPKIAINWLIKPKCISKKDR